MGFTTSSTQIDTASMTASSNSNSEVNLQEQHLSSITETESMIDLSSLDLVKSREEDDPHRQRHRLSSPLLAESDVSSVSTKSSAADDMGAVGELDFLKARWKKMNEHLKKLESRSKK